MISARSMFLERVLIVDDEEWGRRRLQGVLRHLMGENQQVVLADCVAAARAAVEAESFDLALVDIRLPDGTGVELIAWLHDHCPTTVCLVVTNWGDADTVMAALHAGAIGYLLKDRDDMEIAHALENIQHGGAPIDPFVARRILAVLAGDAGALGSHSSGPDGLTEREHEILHLIAYGHNNRQIAELTGLSRFTIEDYTKRIYRKLAVGSRAAAVFKAQSRGLLKS